MDTTIAKDGRLKTLGRHEYVVHVRGHEEGIRRSVRVLPVEEEGRSIAADVKATGEQVALEDLRGRKIKEETEPAVEQETPAGEGHTASGVA